MDHKGQTTFDFAIGMSVFVLATAFVFAFAPGMIQPFTGGLEEETVAANRVADSLADGMLGDPMEPGTLDRACTFAFFDPANNDGEAENDWEPGCNYENTSDLPARLGIEGRPEGTGMHVRVRLVRDLTTTESDDPGGDGSGDDNVANTLCYDANSDRIVEAGDPTEGETECDVTSGDILFAVSDTSPDGVQSIVVARRVVTLEGGFADGTSDVTIVVEVW